MVFGTDSEHLDLQQSKYSRDSDSGLGQSHRSDSTLDQSDIMVFGTDSEHLDLQHSKHSRDSDSGLGQSHSSDSTLDQSDIMVFGVDSEHLIYNRVSIVETVTVYRTESSL